MEQRISLVTLGVTDLARARAFYEALGWTTRAAPDDDVAFFQAGGMVLALWDRATLAEDSGVEDGGGWGGITPAHNVRSPEEVDAVVEEARTAGANIVRERFSRSETTSHCLKSSSFWGFKNSSNPGRYCRTGVVASSRSSSPSKIASIN